MDRLPLQASLELQQLLHEISLPQRVGKSSLLFTMGDESKGAYLIESGTVSLSLKTSRERTVCQRTLGKGTLLGLPATINNAAYSLTAKALCDLEVAFIPRERLVDAMYRNMLLAIEIVKVLSLEVHDMRELIRRKGCTTRKSSPRRGKALIDG